MESAGWIGGFLLTWCGVPLLIDAYRDQECNLPWLLLWAWFLGEVFCLMYALDIDSAPLIFNYSVNGWIVASLMFFRFHSGKAVE